MTRRLVSAAAEHAAILQQDVRYGLRTLWRTPAFTAVVLLTLALGTGTSTAMFTIVEAVVLRPLGFGEPDRLVMVRPTSGARLSPAYFDEWRRGSTALQGMAAWFDVRVNLTGDANPIEVVADRVTSNFFALLGVNPEVGRTLVSRQDLGHVDPEVILSHGFWQRRYGGDPGIVGQAITIDGERVVVAGVMPRGFAVRTTELARSPAEIWLPFPLVPGDPTGMGGFLHVVARLSPGMAPGQAQAELSTIAKRIEAEHPSYSTDWGVNVVSLHEATVENVRQTLLVLFGAVVVLLLIACANVANLILVRASFRQTELAIRRSLGASDRRLVRQRLTEILVLCAAAGLLGVLLATWGTRVLVAAVPAGFELPRGDEIAISYAGLVFAIVLTTLTAVLVGLMPAVQAVRAAPQTTLHETARGASFGRGASRAGGMLIVSEVALALVLLTGAGLLGRSFWLLSLVDPGFRAADVLTIRTTLPESRYGTDERIRAFGMELLDRVARAPGMRAVGFADYLPMSRFGAAEMFEIEPRPGTPPGDARGSWIVLVGGRYFDAMGIPLLRGRLPGPADHERTPSVFVIDEELARQNWPGTDPVGARMVWRGSGETPLVGEVIGVVGNVRYRGAASAPQGTTYFWFPQRPSRQLTIVARTAGDPAASAALVAAEVAAIDPNQPVAEARALREFVDNDLARPRFTMLLLAGFATTAMFLAAIGLYGVIAFGVAQRTREIGIRMALGARSADVLRMVMGRGLRLTCAGLSIGVALALALGRVMAGLLYGVPATDPPTLVAVALTLIAIAILATYLPARRAAKLEPAIALRAD